jgi:eukaryotic-like serine/threonine-protein kinase
MHLVRAADLADAVADPMLGRTLDGRFAVVAKLGSGSMGTVYRAKQLPMGREVAIKILRSDRALDEAAKARFLREARTNSVLVSPHTVTVFDFGESEEGELFLAMELLEGESVGQRLSRVRRLSTDAAIDVARQALLSLAEAHAKGIVHRDLKPDNLFFAKVANQRGQSQEIVKVLDFGIAKMLGENIEMNAIETQAGTVFGTPRYMSPEQAQAKTLDGRTDLYSLGVILYHMLAGRPPFTDDDAIIVMARHIKTAPKPFSEVAADARIPPDLERVVMRTLSKDPAGRPDNADAMYRELTAALEASRSMTSGVRTALANVPSVPPPRQDSVADSLEMQVVASASRRLPPLLFAIGGGALLAIAIVLFFVWPRTKPAAALPPALATAPLVVKAPPSSVPATTTTARATSVVDVSSLPPVPASSPSGRWSGKPPRTTGTANKPPPSAAPAGTLRYGTLE